MGEMVVGKPLLLHSDYVLFATDSAFNSDPYEMAQRTLLAKYIGGLVGSSSLSLPSL